MDKKIIAPYTRIFDHVRRKYELSANEYIIIDLISRLSKRKGYCWASREWLADQIGVSRQGVHKIIQRLIDRGLLAKTHSKKLITNIDTWDMETDGMIVTDETPEQPETHSNDVNKVDKGVNLVDKGVNLVDENVNKVDMQSKQSLHNISNTLEDTLNKHNNIMPEISTGDWTEVKDFYTDKLKSLMSVPPVLDNRFWSKFTKFVKPAFDTWGKDKTIEALEGFCRDEFVQGTGYELHIFGNNPNKYLGMDKYDPKIGLGVDEYFERKRKELDRVLAEPSTGKLEGIVEKM